MLNQIYNSFLKMQTPSFVLMRLATCNFIGLRPGRRLAHRSATNSCEFNHKPILHHGRSVVGREETGGACQPEEGAKRLNERRGVVARALGVSYLTLPCYFSANKFAIINRRDGSCKIDWRNLISSRLGYRL